MTQPKQRTSKQNAALHVYFKELADELNARGLDMKQTLRHDIEIPWDEHNIKEHLWRPVQLAKTGKTSTTELEPGEVSKVYDIINNVIATKFGIELEFPSWEAVMGRDIRN